MARCAFRYRSHAVKDLTGKYYFCRRPTVDGSSYCIFHDPEFWKQHPEELREEFYDIVEMAIEEDKPLIAIGFHLPEVDLSGKVFDKDVLLEGCFFHGKSFFSGSTFQRAFFSGAFFDDADFSYSLFQEADFQGASFTKASFYGSWMGYADFSNTNFGELDFRDVTVQSVYFSNSSFKSADFSFSSFLKASFSNSSFGKALFDGSFIREMLFNGCSFEEAYFRDTTLMKADFTLTTFKGRTHFTGTRFSVPYGPVRCLEDYLPSNIVVFQNVAFERPELVIFDEVNFRYTSLLDTDLTKVPLKKVSWGGEELAVFDELAFTSKGFYREGDYGTLVKAFEQLSSGDYQSLSQVIEGLSIDTDPWFKLLVLYELYKLLTTEHPIEGADYDAWQKATSLLKARLETLLSKMFKEQPAFTFTLYVDYLISELKASSPEEGVSQGVMGNIADAVRVVLSSAHGELLDELRRRYSLLIEAQLPPGLQQELSWERIAEGYAVKGWKAPPPLNEAVFLRQADSAKGVLLASRALQLRYPGSLEDVSLIYKRLGKCYEYNLNPEAAGKCFVREMELRRKVSRKRNLLDFTVLTIYKWLANYGESYHRPLGFMAGAILFFWLLKAGITGNLSASSLLDSFLYFFQLKDVADVSPLLTAINAVERVVAIPIFGGLFIALRRRLERKVK